MFPGLQGRRVPLEIPWWTSDQSAQKCDPVSPPVAGKGLSTNGEYW